MKRAGVTLLELLMVVVIIGILGAVGIPQYIKSQEKARMNEAVNVLTELRSSQARYFAENGTYAASLAALDFDTSQMTGSSLFTYAIDAGGATFTASATRNGTPPTGSGCLVSYKITVTDAGTWAGLDCQST